MHNKKGSEQMKDASIKNIEEMVMSIKSAVLMEEPTAHRKEFMDRYPNIYGVHSSVVSMMVGNGMLPKELERMVNSLILNTVATTIDLLERSNER